MGRLTESQVKRAAALKAVRSAVRLHYSIKADADLNWVLEEVEQKFDSANQEGRKFELDTDDILKRLGASDEAGA